MRAGYARKNLCNGKSLFDLFCEKEINAVQVGEVFEKIKEAIILKEQTEKEHQEMLEKQGFKKPTLQELRENLQRMTWTIS